MSATQPRLLPWSNDEGGPCYLSGDGTGVLSRLADGMESVQLGMGREVLSQAREMLTAERDSRHMETQELRWLASRLAESLSDALRVAESRGLRLPVTREEAHAMTCSVLRFVPHTIRHEPEGGITAELSCAAFGCDAESGPKDDPDAAQDWALKHAGSTGHGLFRRVYTDHARVTREEPQS